MCLMTQESLGDNMSYNDLVKGTDGHPRERTKQLLDHLQQSMENQTHIDRPEYTSDLIDSIAKRWTALAQEDQEYISTARYALVNKMPWNINQ